MRRMLRAWSRYRPRVLTLIVFFVAAAIIALANLSFDEAPIAGSGFHYRSYGWPIIWRRLLLAHHWSTVMGAGRSIGWYCSVPRLVGNLVLWLVLLAALAGTCEWLLRRYRPGLRWRLRTLLVFVALVAMLCGWYANARRRAAIQDPLLTLTAGYGVPLAYVERPGPKWLDLLGIDRLRRRIVVATHWQLRAREPADEQRFLQLASLPCVRHLMGFQVDKLTPATAKALGGMRQLETLEIELRRLTPELPAALSELRELRNLSIRQTIAAPTADDDDARLADECLAAIGNMTNLESLELSNLPLHGKGLACLSGLKNLKSLQVDFFWPGNWNGSRNRKPSSEDCLRAISTLTQIEWLFLDRLIVSNESLSCLAGLPQLKTLGLQWLDTHDRPILSHLPPLARLEALSLWQSNIDDNDLRRLAILPRLKSISLGRTSRSEESLLTPAGLRRLASVKSVEEVQLVGDLESPEAIEALQAVKCLKKLYLESTDSGPGDAGGEMPLDDGEDVLVYDLEAFRRALAALRKAKPGVVTARYGSTVFQRPGSGMPKLDADSLPTRSSSWLPGGDFAWLTPLELADFEKAGWRVSFDKATFPDREGKRLITVEF